MKAKATPGKVVPMANAFRLFKGNLQKPSWARSSLKPCRTFKPGGFASVVLGTFLNEALTYPGAENAQRTPNAKRSQAFRPRAAKRGAVASLIFLSHPLRRLFFPHCLYQTPTRNWARKAAAYFRVHQLVPRDT